MCFGFENLITEGLDLEGQKGEGRGEGAGPGHGQDYRRDCSSPPLDEALWQLKRDGCFR